MSVFAEHQLLFTVAASIVTAVLLALLYVSKSRDADDWAIRLFQDLLANRPGTAPLRGNITVVLPASGKKGVAKELRFGDGVGKPVRLAVDDVRFFSACIAEGSLGLAESYMNNWFHFETGSLYDFTAFLLRNRIKNRIRKMLTLSHKIRGFRTWLHYKLIGHRGTLDEHYGVHNDLYRAMLGDYMVYTCPVVPSITFPAEKAKKLGIPTELRERFYTVPSERQQNGHSNGKSNGKSGSDHAEAAPVYYHPLDEVHFPLSELGLDLDVMQAEKLRRVCEKLQLRPGQRMLDIGCGFGGLSIFASKYYGVHTTGFAITDEMVRMAKEQAARLGATTCTFHSRDLSMLKELPDHSFDAIAGIGVFEHVQTHEYKYVFQQLKRLLTPNGVCLLHAISHPRLPLDPDPFIQRHVFPNSRQIVLSEMTYMMETNELAVIDVDNIGPSYSFGLRFWLDRSLKHFEERAKAGKPYPERFVRMWDAYLSMGTAYSAHGDSCLYQILFHSNSCGQRALDRSAIHFKPLRQTA